MDDLQHAASKIAAGILGWGGQPFQPEGCCRAYDDLVAMAKEISRRTSPHFAGERSALSPAIREQMSDAKADDTL
jgi:hypothetical protein